MIKKIIFGFLWFVNDPQNASRAGAMAGGAAVESLRIYILLGALALSAYCSKKGFLPGIKTKESK